MTPGRIVKVTWQDATMFSGWKQWDELTELAPETCLTVGFVLPRTDKNNIWLSMTQTPNHLGDVLVIPRKWIIKTKVLR